VTHHAPDRRRYGQGPLHHHRTARRRDAPRLGRRRGTGQQRAAGPGGPEGTAFQQRVWRALSAIPFGETRSYGELARELGSAARAVGGACGANPIPIIIPCHRVLAANRRLGGFSGGDGLSSKQQLLAHEGILDLMPEQGSLFAA
jgi:O-6-methylguanine DNA methyltransferase